MMIPRSSTRFVRRYDYHLPTISKETARMHRPLRPTPPVREVRIYPGPQRRTAGGAR